MTVVVLTAQESGGIEMQPSTPHQTAVARNKPRAVVTLFVCVNGTTAEGPSSAETSVGQGFAQTDWPFSAHEVLIPCAGRLQPEHVLKVFEAGADAAVVVACEEDNCHHHDGSRRCRRRVEYVGQILEDIGLGANRILLTHLAGSARETLVSATGSLPSGKSPGPPRSTPLDGLRRQVAAHVAALPPDPMHRSVLPEPQTSELDGQDESED